MSNNSVSINQCQHGHILLRFGNTTIHLSNEQFKNMLQKGLKFMAAQEGVKSEGDRVGYTAASDWIH